MGQFGAGRAKHSYRHLFALLIPALHKHGSLAAIFLDNSDFKLTVDKDEQIRLKEKEFLDKHVFVGLKNLNDGFDSVDIKYFSERDFETVLKRVKDLGLGIYGIEPWKDGEFYGVHVHEQLSADPSDSTWYEEAFSDFKNSGDKLQYSATYYIPENLLWD